MFEYNGPVAAANVLSDFRDDHGAGLAEDQHTKLREILRLGGSPPRVMAGMEMLYALAVEQPFAGAAAQQAMAETLGVLATAWGMGQWISPEKTERAWLVAAWAAHQISPAPEAPPAPLVDPAYTTIPPEVIDPPAPPSPPED